MRPLSPHLQIYAWSWTMAMSTMHRLTGIALYGGTLLVAVWLVAAASGQTSFETAQAIAGSWFGRVALFIYTFVLLHHMMGGLRHLIWDTGAGFSPVQRLNLAKYSVVASISLTLLVWIIALGSR
jgi:succinate dehydrogenase / fumarate reductase cytochrome b subunit